ncbi:MAG: hypothetical protein CVV39_02260 [Planctomycetes bacterium HGW-Planctomycetes-1]|nr:MAG: hypothetical protein CVV39_02260 [Planctomycetes bacterium HGW-Planctomycetes-1]
MPPEEEPLALQPLINLHFARFEFKYILREQSRKSVEKELQYFMELDPFVNNELKRCYFVRSLYFDDPYFSCYHDKIDGLHKRYKFRLRTYAKNYYESAQGFVEIKGRFDQLVFKHRTPYKLSSSDVNTDASQLALKMLETSPETAVTNQFYYELYRKRIRPVVLVDYFRRPYISKYDSEFRLTFDDRIEATPSTSLFPINGSPKAVIPGYVVMEVKFHHKLPAWFHSIIKNYELQRVSVSKMCKGVEACELIKNGM